MNSSSGREADADHDRQVDRQGLEDHDDPVPPKGAGGHSWMMIACCIPMLVIAIALVASGAASPGFLIAALVCTAAMAFMMRGMGHDNNNQRGNRSHL